MYNMRENSSYKLTYNILKLQNLIKKDPSSYYKEFQQQYAHYKSLVGYFKMTNDVYNEHIASLITFLAQVSSCYKEELKDFPDELMTMLKQYNIRMDPAMRMCIFKALILMRNRGLIDPAALIILCFELLRCQDNVLTKYRQVHIVSDIKGLNAKQKNIEVNNMIHNFMFKMLHDDNTTAAKVSLDIMIELYLRHIWSDAKTANAIASACFSKKNKISVAALKFFLGNVEEEEDNYSEDDDTPTVKDVMMANKVNKKSRKRMKLLKRTAQFLKKTRKKRDVYGFYAFCAIRLLHDPQGMAESLLKNLQSVNERFEIKLMVMDLISRLIENRELILLNFYPFLVRYIQPHQREVTKILMFAARSVHKEVPPDAIEPVLKAIADNFITERNSAEVMTVGLEAIYKICERCPFAMHEDLFQDLARYSKYKDENVKRSAKYLIDLLRKINPQILQRKIRSRPTESTKQLQPLEYGALNAKSYIPGCEVLPLGSSGDIDIIKENEDEESCKETDKNDVLYKDTHEASSSDTPKLPAETSQDTKSVAEENSQHSSDNQKETTGEHFTSEQKKTRVVYSLDLLSQEVFKIVKLSKEIKPSKGKKREAGDLGAEELNRGEVVDLKDIEKLHKKPKANKETKLATILEGREAREKSGKKIKKIHMLVKDKEKTINIKPS